MTLSIDAIASELDRKWGPGRLLSLVKRETAERFGYWRDQLADAQDAEFPDDAQIANLQGIVARGWAALDAEATAAGHEPMGGAWVEAEWAPGRFFAIVRDDEHRQTMALRVKAEGRDVAIFSVMDMAKLIASFPDMARVVELFPGAFVTTPPAEFRSGRRKGGMPADEIPFGGDEAA